jgi:hypothetical protein
LLIEELLEEPYLCSGTRGKRPASNSGTVGGGKPADNVPDGSSRKGHRATPATYADEWGKSGPAKEPAQASLLPKGEMADTPWPKRHGGWPIGFLVQ